MRRFSLRVSFRVGLSTPRAFIVYEGIIQLGYASNMTILHQFHHTAILRTTSNNADQPCAIVCPYFLCSKALRHNPALLHT